jgi:minor extracellular serine protease Vpr
MQKKILLFALILLNFQVLFSQNNKPVGTKLSPFTKKYLLESDKNKREIFFPKNYIYNTISGKYYLSAILKVNNDIDTKTLSDLNILIGTKAGNIWTVQIPPENIKAFIQLSGIDYIQLDEPVYINLDSARHDTHVDSVHQGIDLPMAYTGKDVVVGIIDAGFDYTHPTLLDTSGNLFRIKKVWEQKVTGTPPSGYSYGNELTDSAAIRDDGFDVDLFSHGTHVAGIAAGSGLGSSSDNHRFRGMAFESDLVIVGIRPEPNEWISTGLSSIIDGINYIFEYATSVGKPAVVNLSWGCSMGPHDGTSLFSQAVDNLTGEGKIFVCAAGNNGADYIHLNKTFTATDTLVKTFINFSSYLSYKKTWVDVWGEESEALCANLTLYNANTMGNSTGFFCIDDSTHYFTIPGSTGDTCFATVTTSKSDFNGKPRILFDFYNKTSNRILLSLKSTHGTVNAWIGYVENYTGYYGYFGSGSQQGAVAGDKTMTISDISSTHSAIAAAAYASKVKFTNIDGQTNTYSGYTEGNITSFSSRGPSADSLTKPDISAPGMALASSINSFDSTYYSGGANRSSVICNFTDSLNNHEYSYAVMSGTSMASPSTSGIVALMLQANPTLTPSLVKYILQSTAITDNYTGIIPVNGSNTWGYGKINAYAAVRKSWTDANVNNISNPELNCMIYPNPNSGCFRIDYISDINEQISISVSDLTGRNIYTQNWNITKGSNSEKIDFSEVSDGIYFVKIISKKGISVFKTIIRK